MAAPAADFRNVTKDYHLGPLGLGRRRAVTDASLTVDAGQVFGLLGPNRAGKTTLVKVLLTLCRATSGTVHRLGAPAAGPRTPGPRRVVDAEHAFPPPPSPPALLGYFR